MPNILYKYGILSSLMMIWMMGIVTYVTYQVFNDITQISAAATTAYATLFGLPAIAIGVWKWRNSDTNDDGKPDI